MLKKILRPDQDESVEELRTEIREGTKRLVLQAPTGFGKTVVCAKIIEAAREKRKKVIITVPQISLVDQTVRSFFEQGITDVGVIQGHHMRTDYGQPVQVASMQTLMRREIPEAHLVLVDECHKWFAFMAKWMLHPKWMSVPFIGMSATPWTKGLGSYYKKLVVGNTIGNMIQQGTLSPMKVFAASHPDLDGCRRNGDDYNENDLYEAMGKSKLVADIVESWGDLGEDRPTICFCVNRAHAEQVAKEFNAAGVGAGYMDCDTSLNDREFIYKKFKAREYKVICNVDVIGLGVDWPEVSCIIYARPTRSDMRFVQNIGRGLRVHQGKTDLIVIDHSDTHLRLGFVQDIHRIELDEGKPQEAAPKGVVLPKECPQCHFVKPPRQAKCLNCGHVVEHHAKPILCERGSMREVKPGDFNKRGSTAERLLMNGVTKDMTYGQLRWHAAAKGYKKGWADNKYREIFQVWPCALKWEGHVAPPCPIIVSHIKASNIRFAHSKNNPANGHAGNGLLNDRENALVDKVRERYAEFEEEQGLRPV